MPYVNIIISTYSNNCISRKMLTNYQLLAFKKLLSFFLFAANIFGLLPFSFVSSNRHIKYSFLKAFYSVFALCFGSTSYWIIGSHVFGIISKSYFNSFTLKLVTSIHGYSVLIIFLFVYIGPHINSRKIEITYSKCKEIVDVMNEFFKQKRIRFWIYILDIIVKTVVIDIIVVLLSLQSYYRSTNIMTTKFYFLFLLPPIAVRLHLNLFYGALLVFNVYFKKLNESLNDIVTKAKIIGSHNHLMEKSCDLSDEVDAIAILYFRLSEAVKLINSIFSVNNTVGHALIVLGLTIQSLLLFLGIKELIRLGSDFIIFHSIVGFFFILLSSYDLLTTAYAAERLVKEVCNESQFYSSF